MSAICGYALVWADMTEINDRSEKFEPYSFTEPIVAKLLICHDGRANAALAYTSGGLRIWQDDHGLAFQARLGDDRDARRVFSAVSCGSLNSVSFGFRATLTAEDEDGGIVVKRATLSEITLTGCPAYEAAGAWAADSEDLPPKLEALRRHWHANLTTNRPSSIVFVTGPQAARREVSHMADSPIHTMVQAHMAAYLARCPIGR